MILGRRSFLGAAAGALAAPLAAGHPLEQAQGQPKDAIPTPALLVDLDLLEANLRAMADHCRTAGRGLRPHAKTHKCPEIARRQIAAGASGVCAATVPEAEAMAAAGIPGLLLTSPIVDAGKIGRAIAIASRGGQIMLSVGRPAQVQLPG